MIYLSRQPVAPIVVMSVVLALGVSGCSHNRVEHESTETVSSSGSSGEDSQYSSKTETTSEVEHSDPSLGCAGILSCGVQATGEVIAFPFRAIGYVFQSLF